MARRAFLHVGTAKSGTSFLQDLWWQQHDELRDRGLLLPGSGRRDHFAAAAVVKGMSDVVATFGDRELDAWGRLVDETRSWSGDVLVTNEHFSDTPPDAAAAALADLADAADEVHLVLTARDLGRTTRSSGATRTSRRSSTSGRPTCRRPARTSSSYPRRGRRVRSCGCAPAPSWASTPPAWTPRPHPP
jgi:hypothetical protein